MGTTSLPCPLLAAILRSLFQALRQLGRHWVRQLYVPTQLPTLLLPRRTLFRSYLFAWKSFWMPLPNGLREIIFLKNLGATDNEGNDRSSVGTDLTLRLT